MKQLRAPENQDILVFGATGDLARRKLLPSLYELFVAGALPPEGRVIGVSRRALTDRQFRDLALDAVRGSSGTPATGQKWSEFAERLTYVSNMDHAVVARACQHPQRLAYLAIPPDAFQEAVDGLEEVGLVDGTRLVIEKPFGRDVESARALNCELLRAFNEDQIFRIDHYLGKETVQNIIVFRFANSVFERIWNRDAVDHVEITMAESIGIEGRGDFYEEVGAIRDVLQNHLLQVLALLTMEPPVTFTADAIRDEKAKLLRSVEPLGPANVVRGQYTRGRIDGADVPGYRQEDGVSSDSTTETFFAAKVSIDNWRWAGVPFYLRAGKRLPHRAMEVEVAFREAPITFFEEMEVERPRPNHITLSIQPQEEIRFAFLTKAPGPEIDIEPVHMGFSYGETFMSETQEAYERLLHDAMTGDHTLFVRQDAVERQWAIIQPVLDNPPPVHTYPAGTWGPEEATQLIAPGQWHLR